MIEKYLHKDEKILVEVPVWQSAPSLLGPQIIGVYSHHITFFATTERIIWYSYLPEMLRTDIYIPERVYELPYSNIAIRLEKKRKIRWEMVFGGLFLMAIGLSLSKNFKEPIVLLFILLGLPLIAAGFLLGKDAWYQIDSPTMTESERRIWQIPVDAQNAEKFYAIVSEKVGRMY